MPEDIPPEAIDACVPLDALYRVLHHGESAKGDSHRFSVTADPEDATSRVSAVKILKIGTPKIKIVIFLNMELFGVTML